MSKLNLPHQKPSLWAALRLKCPYCREESLNKPGNWFMFKQGCPRCGYRYEREVGYYTGASWMVNFPVTGTLGFLVATFLILQTDLKAMPVAIITSVSVLVFCVMFFPISQGIWMVIEQSFRPLNDDDCIETKESP